MIYNLINFFSERYFGGRYLELSGVNNKSKSLIHEEVTKIPVKRHIGGASIPRIGEGGGEQALSFCPLVREGIAFIVNMINTW